MATTLGLLIQITLRRYFVIPMVLALVRSELQPRFN